MTSLKAMLSLTILFISAVLTVAEIRSLPESYRKAYLAGSVPAIKKEIAIDNERLITAYEAFKVVNKTCRQTAVSASQSCVTCVRDSCKNRARNVCKPTLPEVEPTCDELKNSTSHYCLYYAREEQCESCINMKSDSCLECIKMKCSARVKEVCPPTRPTIEPNCAELKNNSGFYCKYYLHPDQCEECTNATEACKTCAVDSCKARYKEICPPTRPTVEPGCGELKQNASFYCRYYIHPEICPDCSTNKTLCVDCVRSKCSATYLNSCPLNRPTTAPGCDSLKQNASYYCLYYADPSQCSACTDLTSDDCKKCIKTKCKARAQDQCGNFITDAILFFKDDVPNFFENTLPDAFESLGNEIADFAESAFDDVVDFGEDIGEGFAEFGELVEDFGEQLGEDIIGFGEFIFDEVLDPLGEGFDDFFTGIIPDLAVDIGEGFEDFFTDLLPNSFIELGDLFGDFGDILIDDVFDPLGDELIDFGDFLNGELLDPLVGGFDDLGDFLGDLGGDILGGLGDLGGDIGDIFGKKKKRSIHLQNLLMKKVHARRRKRSMLSEPTCDEIKENANKVCLYYNDRLLCEGCRFHPDTDCSGWTKAVADLKGALAKRRWLKAKKENSGYTINSVMYNTTNAVSNFTFTDIEVELQLFGKDLQFNLPQPLNLRNASAIGSAIGYKAVKVSREIDMATPMSSV